MDAKADTQSWSELLLEISLRQRQQKLPGDRTPTVTSRGRTPNAHFALQPHTPRATERDLQQSHHLSSGVQISLNLQCLSAASALPTAQHATGGRLLNELGLFLVSDVEFHRLRALSSSLLVLLIPSSSLLLLLLLSAAVHLVLLCGAFPPPVLRRSFSSSAAAPLLLHCCGAPPFLVLLGRSLLTGNELLLDGGLKGRSLLTVPTAPSWAGRF